MNLVKQAPDPSCLINYLIFRWPFRMGPWMVGTAAGMTGLLSLNYVHRILRLREFAKFSVFAATVPIPAFLTIILNTTMVTESIMLQNTQCPVCLELRAAAIQLGTGFVQPVGLAVFSTIMVASSKKYYQLPPWHQPLAIVRELRKIMQPMHGLLTLLVTVNLFTAFNVARFQMEKMPLIMEKLRSTGMSKLHVHNLK